MSKSSKVHCLLQSNVNNYNLKSLTTAHSHANEQSAWSCSETPSMHPQRASTPRHQNEPQGVEPSVPCPQQHSAPGWTDWQPSPPQDSNSTGQDTLSGPCGEPPPYFPREANRLWGGESIWWETQSHCHWWEQGKANRPFQMTIQIVYKFMEL